MYAQRVNIGGHKVLSSLVKAALAIRLRPIFQWELAGRLARAWDCLKSIFFYTYMAAGAYRLQVSVGLLLSRPDADSLTRPGRISMAWPSSSARIRQQSMARKSRLEKALDFPAFLLGVFILYWSVPLSALLGKIQFWKLRGRRDDAYGWYASLDVTRVML